MGLFYAPIVNILLKFGMAEARKPFSLRFSRFLDGFIPAMQAARRKRGHTARAVTPWIKDC
jgi:hypothetical protein